MTARPELRAQVLNAIATSRSGMKSSAIYTRLKGYAERDIDDALRSLRDASMVRPLNGVWHLVRRGK